MTEDKVQQTIVDGSKAGTLLKDEAFTKAVDAVKSGLISYWQVAKTPEDRERVWMSIHLVDKITDALVIARDNGTVAQQQVEQLLADSGLART